MPLKCPCNVIILDGTLGNLLFPDKITKKQAGRITVNYGRTADDLDISKPATFTMLLVMEWTITDL